MLIVIRRLIDAVSYLIFLHIMLWHLYLGLLEEFIEGTEVQLRKKLVIHLWGRFLDGLVILLLIIRVWGVAPTVPISTHLGSFLVLLHTSYHLKVLPPARATPVKQLFKRHFTRLLDNLLFQIKVNRLELFLTTVNFYRLVSCFATTSLSHIVL